MPAETCPGGKHSCWTNQPGSTTPPSKQPALIFGLVNAILRPPFKALTCLLIILTLGLFTLVINTLLFALTGWIGSVWHVGFTLAQPWFWSAFLGSLITTIIGGILNGVLRDELRDRRHKSHT